MSNKRSYSLWLYVAAFAVCICGGLTACSDDDDNKDLEVFERSDVYIYQPEGGWQILVDQLLYINVECNEEGVSFLWTLDGESISSAQKLEYMFNTAGTYTLVLSATKDGTTFEYEIPVTVTLGDGEVVIPDDATPYITQVFDFMPAVGQFTNTLPAYTEGDTQETMNQKVLEAIGNNNRGMISLGSFGGYVTVGFDHPIENKEGLRDFRILGNAYYAAANLATSMPEGGSCEPGIVMVAYDSNGNGIPDENEWYEIAGSAHTDATQEPWYSMALAAGNDVNLYRDYEITYYKPESEPTTSEEMSQYIRWEDNQGNTGYKAKNSFHSQSYFPLWHEGESLTLRGTCLPQNGIDESGTGSYYVLYKFRYGYADNDTNTSTSSAIDIDWAVNSRGQQVHLPYIHFIKIYCGVNQENGWTGECSTEVMGVEDLHLLGEEIPTQE